MQSGNDPLPFVETSVTRLMALRMKMTHDECGITVVSGPWGIGKTTSIARFAADHDGECIIIKVEPVQSKKGAGPLPVLHQIAEKLVQRYSPSTYLGKATLQWDLRRQICALFERNVAKITWDAPQRFTFIFDEAQYLNRQAIEMLRYWNDPDSNPLPFPVGLIFVGNNEFALEENLKGESVLSGAVRSRLMFELPLAYSHVCDDDLARFARSRGLKDSQAIKDFVTHFNDHRVKRDLRNADLLLRTIRLRAGDGPATREIVNSILNP